MANKTGNISEEKRENTGPNGDRGDAKDKKGEGGHKATETAKQPERVNEGETGGGDKGGKDRPRGVAQGDHPSDVKPGHAKGWGGER